MEIEGSFDNWATRHSLQRSGKDFTLVKRLTPGVYQVLSDISMCNAWQQVYQLKPFDTLCDGQCEV